MARHDFQLNVRVAHELVDWLKNRQLKPSFINSRVKSNLGRLQKEEEKRERGY